MKVNDFRCRKDSFGVVADDEATYVSHRAARKSETIHSVAVSSGLAFADFLGAARHSLRGAMDWLDPAMVIFPAVLCVHVHCLHYQT